MTYRRTLPQQIDEIESFLSKAVKVVDRISGTRRRLSDFLFRSTHNDLSYITRLAVCSVLETNPKRQRDYLKEASKLCDRTFRKLLETHIKFCVEECEVFRRDYRRVPIADTIKDYQESCRTVKDVEEMLNTLNNNVDVSIEQLKQAFDDISVILRDWNTARPELDKKEKPSSFRWFGKVAGVLAGIAGILGFVLKFLGYW